MGKPSAQQQKRHCSNMRSINSTHDYCQASSLLQAKLELAVAEGVVDARSRGPMFPTLQGPRRRERRLLTAVGVSPLGPADLGLGVRGVLQGVVVCRPSAVLDLADLLLDGDHRLAEAVQLIFVLGLGGLDHQGMWHRPRHGRCMEAIVLQALGDVLLDNAGLAADVREVHDELVRTPVVGIGGDDWKVRLKPRLHVIRVENGIARRVGDSLVAEHGAEHPRDDGDACLTPRCGRNGWQVAARRWGDHTVVRQVRCQVFLDADGPQARAAATVRDAEGLVEVQVTHISTNHARRREAQLGVHVGTVHVDLAATVVHDLANLLNVVLEESTGGRVRDHQSCQVVLVSFAQLPELLQVHASGIIDPLDLHVTHDCGCWVGAVRRSRDDADVAMGLANARQVLADHQQTSVLAGSTARGLQGAGIEARAADEVLLQGLQHLSVAGRLAVGRKGMHVGDFRPAARQQRGDRVQLHGARAQGNHGLVQGQVLQLQRHHVAHHLRLRMDAVEDLLLQEGRGACEGSRQLTINNDVGSISGCSATDSSGLQRGDQGHDVLLQVCFVEVGRNHLTVDDPEVELLALELLDQRGRRQGCRREGHCVEEVLSARHSDAQLPELLCEELGKAMYLASDGLQAIRFVVDRIHRRHVGQENLGGAHVGRGLVQADVLLTSLQCQPVGRVAQAVQGLPNDAAWHPAHLLLARRHVRRGGAAEPHGHAEALHGSDHNVCAELAWGLRGDQGKRVCRDDEVRPIAMQSICEARVVEEQAVRVWVLHEGTAELVHGLEVRGLVVTNDQLHAEVLRTQLHEIDALRMHAVAHEELVLRLRVDCTRDHGHGLRSRRALVQQRGVGDLHARELAHQGLEVDQRLQSALGDLWLVGGVSCVPAGILRQVPEHDAGDMRAVVAHADEVLGNDVLLQNRLGKGQRTCLADGAVGQFHKGLAAHRRGDGLRNQLVQVLDTDELAHFIHVLGRWPQVPACKLVGGHEQLLQVGGARRRGRRLAAGTTSGHNANALPLEDPCQALSHGSHGGRLLLDGDARSGLGCAAPHRR
mmetsp:Transcript_50792/g.163025  ORF Transcript_50792/g.163025 Transcript_50792/m.163025 type:complete len:1046 (-) Transcript_50792:41-3178(-)